MSGVFCFLAARRDAPQGESSEGTQLSWHLIVYVTHPGFSIKVLYRPKKPRISGLHQLCPPLII